MVLDHLYGFFPVFQRLLALHSSLRIALMSSHGGTVPSAAKGRYARMSLRISFRLA